GGELSASELHELFHTTYLGVRDPYELVSYKHEADESGDRLSVVMRIGDERVDFPGEGNGPIAAHVHGLGRRQDATISVIGYHEHAMSTGEDAVAAAYVEVDVDGLLAWGVGIHSSIVTASLHAVVNAVNRAALARRQQAAILHAFDAV
ncbi:MAG: 2-isopropylmalate synthase, partial [Gaiellales bacterium]|nr:2-isopropylmalate synthase [Gaiellales bacterium]